MLLISIALSLASPSYAATSPYQNACVAEADLDAAFMAGKGAIVPPTCLPYDAPRTEAALAEALGREATQQEWGIYSYRWFRENEPARVLFRPIDPLPAEVPLPDAGWMMLAALAVLKWIKI